MYVISSHEGPASIAIPSEVISLSIHPAKSSSVRNHLRGQIMQITDAGNHIDIEVMAGERFTATITKNAFQEMGLHPGMPVYINFKASSVGVYKKEAQVEIKAR
jgi:molybdopterin-binding protein